MSLLNEYDLTEHEWKQTSRPLQDRILEKYAKLKALDLVTAIQMFRRDSHRLDSTARAIRRKQGLEVAGDPEDEIVLGDKITNSNSWPVVALLIAMATAAGYGLSQMLTPDPPAAEAPRLPADNVTRVVPGFGTPEDIP